MPKVSNAVHAPPIARRRLDYHHCYNVQVPHLRLTQLLWICRRKFYQKILTVMIMSTEMKITVIFQELQSHSLVLLVRNSKWGTLILNSGGPGHTSITKKLHHVYFLDISLERATLSGQNNLDSETVILCNASSITSALHEEWSSCRLWGDCGRSLSVWQCIFSRLPSPFSNGAPSAYFPVSKLLIRRHDTT